MPPIEADTSLETRRRQKFLRHSYGYPLPHRGNTRNGGTEHGYSRLTDGDANSYWKSNPYLSQKFTGEPDAQHPAWVVIDLGAVEQVSAMRIAWANPYARSYEVQYWTGAGDPFVKPLDGSWSEFTNGKVTGSQGGTADLKLALVAGSRALPAHMDDRVVEHLRHAREQRSAKLRRLRDQRDLCGQPYEQWRFRRSRAASTRSEPDRDLCFVD